jgi:hypothetical protein
VDCRYPTTVRVPESDPAEAGVMFLGRFIAIHIRDDVIANSPVDRKRFNPGPRLD